MSYKFAFRDDQCEFIMAAMDYISERADERIENTMATVFDRWSAARTKERAKEIHTEIHSVIG
jgi:hypothetical protein